MMNDDNLPGHFKTYQPVYYPDDTIKIIDNSSSSLVSLLQSILDTLNRIESKLTNKSSKESEDKMRDLIAREFDDDDYDSILKREKNERR